MIYILVTFVIVLARVLNWPWLAVLAFFAFAVWIDVRRRQAWRHFADPDA